jgi:hypothetical protein
MGPHRAGAVPGRPFAKIGLHSHPDQGGYARHVLVALLRRRCRRIVSHNSRRADLDVHRPGVILPQASARQPRIIKPQVTRPETGIETAPHPARHSRRKRRRKGVVGPIGSATVINWSVATQFYGRICVRKTRDLRDSSNDSPFRRRSKALW